MKDIALMRIIDHEILVLSAKEIKNIINNGGIVDHLDLSK